MIGISLCRALGAASLEINLDSRGAKDLEGIHYPVGQAYAVSISTLL